MNRFVFVLTLALVLALGGIAMAQSSEYFAEGAPLPEGAVEVPVFKRGTNGEFGSSGTGQARGWNSNGTGGHCNRECHEASLTTHVSVAQWIEWSLSATRKDFRVLKPGTFAANSWSANVKSNNDVEIRFSHTDAIYLNDAVESDPIAVRYGYSTGVGGGSDPSSIQEWVAAGDTPITITIPFADVSQAGGADYHIWQEITVTEQHRSSDYQATGTLEVCITNQKHWVDDNGNWADGGGPYHGPS